MQQLTSIQVKLEPDNSQQLANFCGQYDQHIKHLEQHLDVQIQNRGNQFQLTGRQIQLQVAEKVIQSLYAKTPRLHPLTSEQLHLHLKEHAMTETVTDISATDIVDIKEVIIKTRKLMIKPRGNHQQNYVQKISSNDISFGIGPAGTGKTYLAVACAANALMEDRVERIILVRPAVEAGEKLGFLPGDMAQKIDPYLRPLYDALYQMLGTEYTEKMIERNVIEVAPLAFMRGRTLHNAFIIFDESQNSTKEQMQMLLTRVGFGSKVVVTGDRTQVDLPAGAMSGLAHAESVLQNVKGIHFSYFDSSDVVRHPVVQRIIDAYDKHQSQQQTQLHELQETQLREAQPSET